MNKLMKRLLVLTIFVLCLVALTVLGASAASATTDTYATDADAVAAGFPVRVGGTSDSNEGATYYNTFAEAKNAVFAGSPATVTIFVLDDISEASADVAMTINKSGFHITVSGVLKSDGKTYTSLTTTGTTVLFKTDGSASNISYTLQNIKIKVAGRLFMTDSNASNIRINLNSGTTINLASSFGSDRLFYLYDPATITLAAGATIDTTGSSYSSGHFDIFRIDSNFSGTIDIYGTITHAMTGSKIHKVFRTYSTKACNVNVYNGAVITYSCATASNEATVFYAYDGNAAHDKTVYNVYGGKITNNTTNGTIAFLNEATLNITGSPTLSSAVSIRAYDSGAANIIGSGAVLPNSFNVTGTATISFDDAAAAANGYVARLESSAATEITLPDGRTASVRLVGAYHKTLASVFSAATDGDTIVVLKNITGQSDSLTVPASTSLTVKGVNSDVSITRTASKTYLFVLEAGAKLTLDDIKIVADGYAINVKGSSAQGTYSETDYYHDASTVLIIGEGAKVHANTSTYDQFLINMQTGMYSDIVVHGEVGYLESTGNTNTAYVFYPASNDWRGQITVLGKVVLKASKKSGDWCNIIRAPQTGGTFKALPGSVLEFAINATAAGSYTARNGVIWNNGTTVIDGAIISSSHNVVFADNANATCSITNSYILACGYKLVGTATNATAAANVTTSNLYFTDVAAPGGGYYARLNTATFEVVEEKNCYAEASLYKTLAAAVTASADGNTVYLLANITEAGATTNIYGKSITITSISSTPYTVTENGSWMFRIGYNSNTTGTIPTTVIFTNIKFSGDTFAQIYGGLTADAKTTVTFGSGVEISTTKTGSSELLQFRNDDTAKGTYIDMNVMYGATLAYYAAPDGTTFTGDSYILYTSYSGTVGTVNVSGKIINNTRNSNGGKNHYIFYLPSQQVTINLFNGAHLEMNATGGSGGTTAVFRSDAKVVADASQKAVGEEDLGDLGITIKLLGSYNWLRRSPNSNAQSHTYKGVTFDVTSGNYLALDSGAFGVLTLEDVSFTSDEMAVASSAHSNNVHWGIVRVGDTAGKGYYSSLTTAFTAVPTDGTETNVYVLSDTKVSAMITFADNLNVKLYGLKVGSATVYPTITETMGDDFMFDLENGALSLSNINITTNGKLFRIMGEGKSITLGTNAHVTAQSVNRDTIVQLDNSASFTIAENASFTVRSLSGVTDCHVIYTLSSFTGEILVAGTLEVTSDLSTTGTIYCIDVVAGTDTTQESTVQITGTIINNAKGAKVCGVSTGTNACDISITGSITLGGAATTQSAVVNLGSAWNGTLTVAGALTNNDTGVNNAASVIYYNQSALNATTAKIMLNGGARLTFNSPNSTHNTVFRLNCTIDADATRGDNASKGIIITISSSSKSSTNVFNCPGFNGATMTFVNVAFDIQAGKCGYQPGIAFTNCAFVSDAQALTCHTNVARVDDNTVVLDGTTFKTGYYSTANTAINSIPSGSTATVYVLANVTVSAFEYADRNITITSAGETVYTITSPTSGSANFIWLNGNASLTLKNVTLNLGRYGIRTKNSNNHVTLNSGATMQLGNAEGQWLIRLETDNSSVTVNAGATMKVTSTTQSCYLIGSEKASATVTINGGTFENASKGHIVNVSLGTVEISGGTFTHTGTGNIIHYNASTVAIRGTAQLTHEGTGTAHILYRAGGDCNVTVVGENVKLIAKGSNYIFKQGYTNNFTYEGVTYGGIVIKDAYISSVSGNIGYYESQYASLINVQLDSDTVAANLKGDTGSNAPSGVLTNMAPIRVAGKGYYSSLTTAFTAVPTDGTETNVYVLSDTKVSAIITFADNLNVKLYGLKVGSATVYPTITETMDDDFMFDLENGALSLSDINITTNGKLFNVMDGCTLTLDGTISITATAKAYTSGNKDLWIETSPIIYLAGNADLSMGKDVSISTVYEGDPVDGEPKHDANNLSYYLIESKSDWTGELTINGTLAQNWNVTSGGYSAVLYLNGSGTVTIGATASLTMTTAASAKDGSAMILGVEGATVTISIPAAVRAMTCNNYPIASGDVYFDADASAVNAGLKARVGGTLNDLPSATHYFATLIDAMLAITADNNVVYLIASDTAAKCLGNENTTTEILVPCSFTLTSIDPENIELTAGTSLFIDLGGGSKIVPTIQNIKIKCDGAALGYFNGVTVNIGEGAYIYGSGHSTYHLIYVTGSANCNITGGVIKHTGSNGNIVQLDGTSAKVKVTGSAQFIHEGTGTGYIFYRKSGALWIEGDNVALVAKGSNWIFEQGYCNNGFETTSVTVIGAYLSSASGNICNHEAHYLVLKNVKFKDDSTARETKACFGSSAAPGTLPYYAIAARVGNETGSMTIDGEVTTFVGGYYTRLTEAIDAIKSTGTITLINDLIERHSDSSFNVLPRGFTIPAGKQITITGLANTPISLNKSNATFLFTVAADAKLTVQDITFTGCPTKFALVRGELLLASGTDLQLTARAGTSESCPIVAMDGTGNITLAEGASITMTHDVSSEATVSGHATTVYVFATCNWGTDDVSTNYTWTGKLTIAGSVDYQWSTSGKSAIVYVNGQSAGTVEITGTMSYHPTTIPDIDGNGYIILDGQYKTTLILDDDIVDNQYIYTNYPLIAGAGAGNKYLFKDAASFSATTGVAVNNMKVAFGFPSLGTSGYYYCATIEDALTLINGVSGATIYLVAEEYVQTTQLSLPAFTITFTSMDPDNRSTLKLSITKNMHMSDNGGTKTTMILHDIIVSGTSPLMWLNNDTLYLNSGTLITNTNSSFTTTTSSGTVYINNAVYNPGNASGKLITNKGTLVIDGANTEIHAGADAAIYGDAGGSITINDGTFTCSYAGGRIIYLYKDSTTVSLTINGGSFTSNHLVDENDAVISGTGNNLMRFDGSSHVITFNGGTFTANGTNQGIRFGDNTTFTFTINGGTYRSQRIDLFYFPLAAKSTNSTFTINGGTFTVERESMFRFTETSDSVNFVVKGGTFRAISSEERSVGIFNNTGRVAISFVSGGTNPIVFEINGTEAKGAYVFKDAGYATFKDVNLTVSMNAYGSLSAANVYNVIYSNVTFTNGDAGAALMNAGFRFKDGSSYYTYLDELLALAPSDTDTVDIYLASDLASLYRVGGGITIGAGKTVTIDGLGHNARVNGSNTQYLFCIAASGTLVLKNITFSGMPTHFAEVLGTLRMENGAQIIATANVADNTIVETAPVIKLSNLGVVEMQNGSRIELANPTSSKIYVDDVTHAYVFHLASNWGGVLTINGTVTHGWNTNGRAAVFFAESRGGNVNIGKTACILLSGRARIGGNVLIYSTRESKSSCPIFSIAENVLGQIIDGVGISCNGNYALLSGVVKPSDEHTATVLGIEWRDDIVSVTIVWGAMTFVYTPGMWDVEEHVYEEGTWAPDETEGNQITLTNTGDIAVTAGFDYDTETGFENLAGTFQQNGETITELALPVGDTSYVITFNPNGDLAENTQSNTVIGIITITLTEGGN